MACCVFTLYSNKDLLSGSSAGFYCCFVCWRKLLAICTRGRLYGGRKQLEYRCQRRGTGQGLMQIRMRQLGLPSRKLPFSRTLPYSWIKNRGEFKKFFQIQMHLECLYCPGKSGGYVLAKLREHLKNHQRRISISESNSYELPDAILH